MATAFLVTGAQGCIGAWVVKNLVEMGTAVTVFDVDTTARRLGQIASAEQIRRVHFVQGDVADAAAVEAAVATHGISHIIHLATLQIPACRADPLAGARVNVLGTLALFEAARRHTGQVQRVVYASSAAVLGPEEAYDSGPVGDEARLLPRSHYGVFKQANEGNARIYWQDHGLASIGLRPYTIYGVGRDQGMTSAPTKAVKAAVAGRPYTIGFSGPNDFLYVDDCAKAFIQCALVPFAGAAVFNIGGVRDTVENFVALVQEQVSGAQIRVEGKPIPTVARLDDRGLRRLLPDLPRTPLREGVARTLAGFRWLQQQGQLDLSDLAS